jgi:hypothetical protein
MAAWLYDQGGIEEADVQSAFLYACWGSRLQLAQWLQECLGGEDWFAAFDDAFYGACANGHLEIAKWLWGEVQDHWCPVTIFLDACRDGYLPIAKWLCEMGMTQESLGDGLVRACGKGHFETARWLHGKLVTDTGNKRCSAFISACEGGSLDIAQWLWSGGMGEPTTSIASVKDDAFTAACVKGHLQTAQWVWSLGGVDIHMRKDSAFCWAGMSGSLEIARWMMSLDPDHDWPRGPVHALKTRAGSWSPMRHAWAGTFVRTLYVPKNQKRKS